MRALLARKHAAATIISAYVRGFCAARRFQRQKAAVLVIEAATEQWLEHKRFEEWQAAEAAAARARLECAAATTIAAGVRGWSARRAYGPALRVIAVNRQQNAAALAIQTVRKYLSSCEKTSVHTSADAQQPVDAKAHSTCTSMYVLWTAGVERKSSAHAGR